MVRRQVRSRCWREEADCDDGDDFGIPDADDDDNSARLPVTQKK